MKIADSYTDYYKYCDGNSLVHVKYRGVESGYLLFDFRDVTYYVFENHPFNFIVDHCYVLWIDASVVPKTLDVIYCSTTGEKFTTDDDFTMREVRCGRRYVRTSAGLV